MKAEQEKKRLAKYIAYVLGRSPDEFGLVPDAEGFFKIKEILQAMTEEIGWKHLRKSHLDELLLARFDIGFEIEGHRIRSTLRARLPVPVPADEPPKLLYTCIRTKAHPFVLKKGIFPAGRDQIVLAANPELAVRIGRRKDRNPVMLTVRSQACIAEGGGFLRFGERLYLTEFVPPGCFSGPALPKEKAHDVKTSPPLPQKSRQEGGVYFPELTAPVEKPRKSDKLKSRKEPDWKKQRRRQRRQKDHWSSNLDPPFEK